MRNVPKTLDSTCPGGLGVADLRQKSDIDGFSVAHYAVVEGHTHALATIANHDMKLRTNVGSTIAHLPAQHGHPDTLKHIHQTLGGHFFRSLTTTDCQLRIELPNTEVPTHSLQFPRSTVATNFFGRLFLAALSPTVRPISDIQRLSSAFTRSWAMRSCSGKIAMARRFSKQHLARGMTLRPSSSKNAGGLRASGVCCSRQR
jgi:hypothetical protein